jgi:hypothetical protein
MFFVITTRIYTLVERYTRSIFPEVCTRIPLYTLYLESPLQIRKCCMYFKCVLLTILRYHEICLWCFP